MPELNKRLHLLLSEEQFLHLKELARRRNRGVAELVRDAIDLVYRPSSELSLKKRLDELRQNHFITTEKLSQLQSGADR